MPLIISSFVNVVDDILGQQLHFKGWSVEYERAYARHGKMGFKHMKGIDSVYLSCMCLKPILAHFAVYSILSDFECFDTEYMLHVYRPDMHVLQSFFTRRFFAGLPRPTLQTC